MLKRALIFLLTFISVYGSSVPGYILKLTREPYIKISGYFVHYDKGPYDWIYISRKRTLIAKLEGLDPSTGYLKWLILKNKNKGICYIDCKIYVRGTRKRAYFFPCHK